MTDKSNGETAAENAAKTEEPITKADISGQFQTDRGKGPAASASVQNRVRFNTDSLKSTYCNVCNGSSTREEVVLNFGVNENWDMGVEEIDVTLHHRIALSPHAAKRLRDMVVRLIDEHERRYGKLDG